MQITKRNGQTEPYHLNKIASAVLAAFNSVNASRTQQEAQQVAELAQQQIFALADAGQTVSVEQIQDIVERAMMARGYYDEVKSFILYREGRSKKRRARQKLAADLTQFEVEPVLKGIQQDYPQDAYALDALLNKYETLTTADLGQRERLAALIRAAVELTSQEAPKWEFIAARLQKVQMLYELAPQLEQRAIHGFYDKVSYLTGEGLYGEYILKHYTKAELDEAEGFIVPQRDHLLTYSALDMLLSRYVIRTGSHVLLETPQEMFLGIALHLAMLESKNRMQWVRSFYDMLSQLQVTMATPTLSNARKPYHQLSSCFIDTVPDTLSGIYRSIDNFAQASKYGGGMGLYFGKVRAAGSTIRGFEGAAGGVIRWIKLANDTAVAVDQLGMRQGAAAVYLDAWHRDVPEFLQLRTNNGDDRMKAHDVFPALCYPDLFWRMAKEDLNATWYLMCPHQVKTVKGYALEDSFGEQWEQRYWDCVNDARIAKREIPLKELVRLILKSAVETGTPFAFYRDTVNKLNPNSHKGMIYCSNLCTEIAQNMSGIETVSREITTQDGETVIVTTTRPGDFVVCNLASLSLGHIDTEDADALRTVVRSAVRALDNVIDLNYYPLLYAKVTNRRYRPVGLGVSGYHHMLAKRGIAWESQAHLDLADKVFEQINFAAIQASHEIALEKGSYEYFEGSDWQTGEYFAKRGYDSPQWKQLREDVASGGMRNAYLIAVAPTSSTSIIAGTTAGLDPVMGRFFLEEKKNRIMPRVAPDLAPQNFWLYKSAHTIDQAWSIRAGGIRQRHIDQAQSMNVYITNEYSFKQILNLYILAWEHGVKTLYYIRSKALEVDECESCSS